MTSYAPGYRGPMLPAAGPRGSIGGGGSGAMGGIQTAHQGLNQISDAVNQINNATGSGGGGSRPSVGGVTADDFGDYGGVNLSTGDAQPTSQNTSASLLKSLGLKKGGKVPSAAKRGDGIATKGRTKGRFV